MPEAAILDLPLIEFEQFADRPSELHALCIRTYGISGLEPAPGAAFHFTASLWRYRGAESLFQVAALGALYLRELSHQKACLRGLRAVGSKKEGGSSRTAGEADAEMSAAQRGLDLMDRQISAFTTRLSALQGQNPSAAERVLRANTERMGDGRWATELEAMLPPLLLSDLSKVVLAQPLDRLMADLAHAQRDILAARPLAARGTDFRRRVASVSRQAELTASRLKTVVREKQELEELLHSSEQKATDSSFALEEARTALEVTLAEAQERLDRLEREQVTRSSSGRDTVTRVKAERDALAAELLISMERATNAAHAGEDAFGRLEESAAESEEAATVIEALSNRLRLVQQEIEDRNSRADEMKSERDQSDRNLDGLRGALVDAEQRCTSADATIRALEGQLTGARVDADRSSEFEVVLTESESRLANTEDDLISAQTRVEGLAAEIDDLHYEIEKSYEREREQKEVLDAISGQLAEAETLSNEKAARIEKLERDLDFQRKELSRAQSEMLDAKGDMDDVQLRERRALTQIETLTGQLEERIALAETLEAEGRERLDEDRLKITELGNELEQLRRDSKEIGEEKQTREQELAESRTRLEELEGKTADLTHELAEQTDHAQGLERDVEARRQDLEGVQAKLEDSTVSAERHESDARNLRHDLEKREKEHTQAAEAATAAERRFRQAQIDLVDLRQELVEAREDARNIEERAEDRLSKLDEELSLIRDRLGHADSEKQMLLDALSRAEDNRHAEKNELEEVISKLKGETGSRHQTLLDTQSAAEKTRYKLNETEAFLIARQREIDRLERRNEYLISEIGEIADLRTQIENTKDPKKINEYASKVANKLDNLFAEAGRPIHADRRTEKLVVLHLKKDAQELASEEKTPFLATGGKHKSSEAASNESESEEE